jgi:hypothetical protein
MSSIQPDAEPDAHRLPMMAHLLQLGMDVDAFDLIEGAFSRGTALWWAVSCRMFERARFLLEHGADPHRAKGLHKSPYEEAKI